MLLIAELFYNLILLQVVLVTGGTGLVGKSLETVLEMGEENLEEEWIFVSSKDANLENEDETMALFAKHQPTHVVHLAAKVWKR